MASPVQRNACGCMVDAIVPHIVGDSVIFDLDRRLLRAAREWQDPNAILNRSGASAADAMLTVAMVDGG